jgi:hypothetical protein
MQTNHARFWVSYTGWLAFEGALKPDDPVLQALIQTFAPALRGHTEAVDGPVIVREQPNGAEIVISGVVTAATDAEALANARTAFTTAIEKAPGWRSNLPDGDHPCWRTHELLKRSTVVPLAAA